MDRTAEKLTISPAAIRDGHVAVAERDGVVVGYYQITGEPPHGELADLFLEPEEIGTGLGRTLWEHADASARGAGFRTLRVRPPYRSTVVLIDSWPRRAYRTPPVRAPRGARPPCGSPRPGPSARPLLAVRVHQAPEPLCGCGAGEDLGFLLARARRR
ncbi:GNAT family N-acetyltransferase [Streptomyces boncukensis]|uniref:GNAT family N-acetyltransferase n=1 Tax=Streptomyces boncukensis TaxID=2711219 RepID=A0A6G4X3M3_9ACTN|nr:GNAT family N-acetyltransferase [Streptomyces boncukensis]